MVAIVLLHTKCKEKLAKYLKINHLTTISTYSYTCHLVATYLCIVIVATVRTNLYEVNGIFQKYVYNTQLSSYEMILTHAYVLLVLILAEVSFCSYLTILLRKHACNRFVMCIILVSCNYMLYQSTSLLNLKLNVHSLLNLQFNAHKSIKEIP